MSLVAWQASILDADGDVQEGVSVSVTLADLGSPATLYTDREGVTPLANPCETDADGFVRFYAAADRYNIIATKGSLSRTWLDVELVPSVANAILVDDTTTLPAGQTDNLEVPNGVEVYRISAHASGSQLSGVLATDSARRVVVLANPGSVAVVLLHNSGGSTAGNRFALPGEDSFYIMPNTSVRIWQDPVTAAWRLI